MYKPESEPVCKRDSVMQSGPGRNQPRSLFKITLNSTLQASREALLLAAVNSERRAAGREVAPRLTLRCLRAFMRGKTAGGRPWAPTARRRDDLVTDAMCALCCFPCTEPIPGILMGIEGYLQQRRLI